MGLGRGCLWKSDGSGTINWRVCPSFIELLVHICQKAAAWAWFWVLCSLPQSGGLPHQCRPVLTTVTAALTFLFRNCLGCSWGFFSSSHRNCGLSCLRYRRPSWGFGRSCVEPTDQCGETRHLCLVACRPWRARVCHSEPWLLAAARCRLQHTEAVHVLLDSHLSTLFNVHILITNIEKYSWYLCLWNPVAWLSYSRDSLGFFYVDSHTIWKQEQWFLPFPSVPFLFLPTSPGCTSRTVLSQWGQMSLFVLGSGTAAIKCRSSCGFFVDAVYQVEEDRLYSYFSGSF